MSVLQLSEKMTMRKFIHRHPGAVLYLVMFISGAWVLHYGMEQHLFGAPAPGTDQRSILLCALDLVKGKLPDGQYRYSYAYTVFLAVDALLSGGKLWLMRLGQLAVAAFIPVAVFRTARLCRTGKPAAFLAGACCCAFAPLVLIALDFLRAAPLALAFVGFANYLLAAEFPLRRSGERWHLYAAAGFMGALCVLGRENFLVVVPLPLLWLWRRGRRGVCSYLGALALPLLPVLIFNLIRYHSFQFVPGNAGNILGFYGGSGAGTASDLWNLFGSVPGHLRDMALSYELHNSLSVYAHRELVPFLEVLCLPFNLLWILAAAGAALTWRRPETRRCALLVLGYFASMAFFTVFYRFRIPAVPLLAVLAAAAFRELAKWMKCRRYGRVALFAAVAVALFALTWVDPDSRRLESERAAVARIMIHNRRYVEAERYLERMAADGLDPRPEWRFYAQRCAAEGDRYGVSRAISRLKALSKPR